MLSRAARLLSHRAVSAHACAASQAMDYSSPNLEDILESNQKWVEKKRATDAGFFDKLGAVHKPKYLYVGCSDARVPANEIMGLDAGEVFVHRNVANLVVSTDLNFLSVLTYGVNVLKVEHIMVCGHYDCGGVWASMKKQDHGLIEPWLRNIRDVYNLHKEELDAIEDETARHRRLVERNVMEQCLNIFKTGVVQQKRLENAKELEQAKAGGEPVDVEFVAPRVHALVFDPREGVLHRLPVNWKEEIDHRRHIYDLYEAPSTSKL